MTLQTRRRNQVEALECSGGRRNEAGYVNLRWRWSMATAMSMGKYGDPATPHALPSSLPPPSCARRNPHKQLQAPCQPRGRVFGALCPQLVGSCD